MLAKLTRKAPKILGFNEKQPALISTEFVAVLDLVRDLYVNQRRD